MKRIFSEPIEHLGVHDGWLIGVGLLMSALLAVAVVAYRRLRHLAQEDRRHSADLIHHLSDGIYRSSLDGRQLAANPALVKLNGYASEAEQLAGVRDIATEWYVDPQRRGQFRALLDRNGKVEDFVSEIYRHKTRERIWITESARLVHDRKTGKALYYEGSVREITETVKRLDLESQFQMLTKSLPVGLFHFVRRADERFEVLFLAEAASRISGIPVAEQIANPGVFSELVCEQDREGYWADLNRSKAGAAPWDSEFRIVARDSLEKWVRINAQAQTAGGETHWYGYISDISVRKRQEMEIRQLAYFDPLTKLPNRRMFLDRLAQTIEDCALSGGWASLLYVDLDNFKTLNDSHGHHQGDLLLTQVAGRVGRCIAPQDLVARIGGDEFVVVIPPDGKDRSMATLRGISTAHRILSDMQTGFDLGAIRYSGSASIGIVVFDGLHENADELLKRADIAMYEAKAAGRNGMSLFDPALIRPDRRDDALTAVPGAGQLELDLSEPLDAVSEPADAQAVETISTEPMRKSA